MVKTDFVSIGNCGEYFVAAELERNGYTAAVPMSNTKEFDILAVNKQNYKQVAIQVKTNHTKARTWTLSEKNEKIIGDNIYYVFVSLNELDAPDYYIVPSSIVARSISTTHRIFLETKKKDGTFKKDTSIRKFSFDYEKYNPLNLDAETYKSTWNRLTQKHYDLTKHIPTFKKDSFGEWYCDKNADGTEQHPFHFPCVSYNDDVEKFESEVKKFIDIYPEMDLEHYRDILKRNDIDSSTIKDVDVETLESKCICAMIVANILAEHFCEGAIMDSCKDKTFLKWLERLRNLDNL